MKKNLTIGLVAVVVIAVAVVASLYINPEGKLEREYEAYRLEQIELNFKANKAFQSGDYNTYNELKSQLNKLEQKNEHLHQYMREHQRKFEDSPAVKQRWSELEKSSK
ncbi:hypothetical protein LS71_008335 [Helicobacter jaachi]|uniref:Uncharacterized protein n=1 Tax=Helicobacter jaachi TaxID=1677920 RepID=A0A4U8T775_9HELI|nr:hypothetical protein [Helicobacter jaachi]TLD95405.1 hypothetical protein LS71_008335 [Helicobacter jaachi]